MRQIGVVGIAGDQGKVLAKYQFGWLHGLRWTVLTKLRALASSRFVLTEQRLITIDRSTVVGYRHLKRRELRLLSREIRLVGCEGGVQALHFGVFAARTCHRCVQNTLVFGDLVFIGVELRGQIL